MYFTFFSVCQLYPKIKLFTPGFQGQSQEFSFKYQKSSENKRNHVIRTCQ